MTLSREYIVVKQYDLSYTKKIRNKESETKDGLKPICNDGCVILGRSEAKDQNNAIVVTVRLQSFGTHLRAVDLTQFNGINRRPF